MLIIIGIPRRRRNWSVIAFFALLVAIAALFLNYSQNQLNVQSNQASIDYWLGNSGSSFVQSFPVYNYSTPVISANCKNDGGMDGDFNLIISFTNATFSHQTEQPYSQTNNTSVVMRYILHKGDSGTVVPNLLLFRSFFPF